MLALGSVMRDSSARRGGLGCAGLRLLLLLRLRSIRRLGLGIPRFELGISLLRFLLFGSQALLLEPILPLLPFALLRSVGGSQLGARHRLPPQFVARSARGSSGRLLRTRLGLGIGLLVLLGRFVVLLLRQGHLQSVLHFATKRSLQHMAM
jgi:hypothetical protein